MKIKTANLRLVPLDYVMTSIVEPDALQYGVSDWREQRLQTNGNREYQHRYHQNMNLLRPLMDQYAIFVGPSPLPGGAFAAGIGSDSFEGRIRHSLLDKGECIMQGATYEEAICRTIVAREKGQEVDIPIELMTLKDLETQYVHAANELHADVADGVEISDLRSEMDALLAVRKAITEHAEFQGTLPVTKLVLPGDE